jgi:hypothetical protein
VSDTEAPDTYPVYACDWDDIEAGEKPIGHAANKRQALRMIKSELGDNDLTAADIIWSSSRKAYIVDG